MSKVNFTAARVAAHTCPKGQLTKSGKPINQAFIWDNKASGLGLRATVAGAKAYIFQGILHGATVRVTIGDPCDWTIDQAQAEARRLQRLLDEGVDPREHAAEQRAAYEARKVEARRHDVTLADAWAVYLAERRSKWSELHYRDHIDLSSLGGQPKKRGKGLTEPGPLAVLMPRKLSDLNAGLIAPWLDGEAAKRPARARLAFNLLRIFATWCETKTAYRGLIDPLAVSSRLSRDTLPKAAAKTDALQREQLGAWFSAVRHLGNPVMEAYLIGLLLTGARREELAELRWNEVDFTWRSLHLKDKVEKTTGRTIPLTPYFASVLRDLKRINDTPPNVRRMRELDADGKPWSPSPWVFSSPSAADGRLAAPNRALHRACQTAGVPPVTLHGLRRSFSSLAEWTETPTGVVAQIMGHKPSATAERHYKVRPLDLLRMWHDKIETWMLEQAGIEFDATVASQGLRAAQ
jgi:integrase